MAAQGPVALTPRVQPSLRRNPFDTPLKLGLAVSAALLAGLLVSETVSGRWPVIRLYAASGAMARQGEGVLRDFRIAIVHCLLAGYLVAAFWAVLRGGRSTVYALQKALDCSREECGRLADSVRLLPGWLVAFAVFGLLVALAGPYIVPPVPETPWHPSTWSPEVTWHRILGPLVGVFGALLAYAILAMSGRMSRLAADLSKIDLFDLAPLLPFTQQGLTNALLLLGAVSIAGLMLLTETGFGFLALILGVPGLIAAGLALVLPLRGVHRRIQQAKDEEIAWVDGEIRARRTALKDQPGARTGEFADLAAYRHLVADVQEWPISAAAYVRFTLYLLIPVISWAAAALVERVVDAFMS